LDLQGKLAELEKLSHDAPELPAESEADVAELEKLESARSDFEAKVVGLNETLSNLEELSAIFAAFEKQVATFNARIEKILKSVGLGAEVTSLTATAPSKASVAKVVDSRRTEIEQEITVLSHGELQSVESLTASIISLQEKLNFSTARKSEYEKFQADRKALDETITSLKREIGDIEQNVVPTLNSQRASRIERYLDFFDILLEERGALEKLYDPLGRALSQGGETDKKLTFASKIAFNATKQAFSAMELIDSRKRRSPYREQEDLEIAIKKAMTKIEHFGYDREKTRDVVLEFRNTFLHDPDGNEITFADHLRKGKTEEDFNNWFFDVSNFSVNYSIKFDDKELQLLSPGQKGIVLLLVYLEVDQDDSRPLIIDQPEDNLDSLSVYSNLIEFFRERKRTRQIIIITHNPNLVVNTDAEQIIIADFNGSRNPHIQYRSGALEDVSSSPDQPSIREGVCRVLEGGEEAFLRREQKYAISGMPS
jgi:chromosome segregation ATPase